MIIDFEAELEDGTVEFKGNLNKEEVGFLLRYALLSLLSQGLLPNSVHMEDIPDKGQMN